MSGWQGQRGVSAGRPAQRARDMDLDSDSDSSKPDMRDDLDDSHSSSHAQGSSLGAESMGMQVRSSSSEDGSSPLESPHGMALDYDSATDSCSSRQAGAAGKRKSLPRKQV